MIRATAVLTFLATAAYPLTFLDVNNQLTYQPLVGQEDGAVGRFVFNNKRTFGATQNEELAVETDYGLMVVRLDLTPNAVCPGECPDIIEAITWPSQMAIVPVYLEVAEGEVGEMRVYEVVGF